MLALFAHWQLAHWGHSTNCMLCIFCRLEQTSVCCRARVPQGLHLGCHRTVLSGSMGNQLLAQTKAHLSVTHRKAATSISISNDTD